MWLVVVVVVVLLLFMHILLLLFILLTVLLVINLLRCYFYCGAGTGHGTDAVVADGGAGVG